MADSDGPACRKLLIHGGPVAAGRLFAGCTGSSESDAMVMGTAATDITATADAAVAGESTTESTANGSLYVVSMAPTDDVTFRGASESIFMRLTHHARTVFVFGHGGAVSAMHAPDYYGALWNQFTPRFPDAELDRIGLYSSWGPLKERLYELDSNMHLTDPASVSMLGNWNQADLGEIEENISPQPGNNLGAQHQVSPTEWVGAYEYYGLQEIFAKIVQVLQAEVKYEALTAVHEELLVMIATDPPTEEDRSAAVLFGPNDLESIYAYNLSMPGLLIVHTRPSEPINAFGDNAESGSTVDSETPLGADPGVIPALGGTYPNMSIPDTRTGFQNDSVGAKISTVKNDRIHTQGGRYQGPILNLFQLETAARQLFLDRFSVWSQYSEGSYPEASEEGQLFDRQRAVDIINGNP